MTAAIRHRGPDGDGFFCAPDVVLGMRRLSIIDVAGSDQPLYNEDRSLALVFNGEIYNYRELRETLAARGHRFATAGDGETLLHLYEEHGLDLFAHLRGMYAIALWDSARSRLIVAVDHIGMKPLYLHERDGITYFASEVKALAAVGAPARQINLDVLDTYLSFGYMIGEQTLFAHVRRLMPGHALVVEGGAARTVEYSSILSPQSSALNDDPISTARSLLEDSVRLHLRSDVPLGLFLSGGVDSAAVLALMTREAGGRVLTYTVGYQGETPDNELAQAKRTAAHFGSQHVERVISADDWWDALPRYVDHLDEPVANASAVAQMLLAEETAKHVKVVLTGLGGDELFGGYMHHRTIPWLLSVRERWRDWEWLAGPLGRLEGLYPRLKNYRIVGALPTYLPRIRQALLPLADGLRRMLSYDGMVMSDALRKSLYGADLRAAWGRAQHKERTFAHLLARSMRDEGADTALALIQNTWLHGNALLYCDKVTMAHSLEARVPFFDPALLQFAAATPVALRMRGNKHILRAAMRPYLPDFALERPKQPFSTPIRGWFDGVLCPRIVEVLLDGGARVRAYFDRAGYERIVRAHMDGRAKHEELILRLLLLELWLQ
jgi:asparagine synthase (glutamine-hydrolysing)